MTIKNVTAGFIIAIIGGVIALGGEKLLFDEEKNVQASRNNQIEQTEQTSSHSRGSSNAQYTSSQGRKAINIDFQEAVNKSVNTVVHVKTAVRREGYQNPLLRYFYGKPDEDSGPIMRGSGSGVIVSQDGYIVTNNHVIEKSDKITVVLNDKREFKAKVIGNDPTTDIALLKIDAQDLPTIQYGNSNQLKVGEWVLAVGNPFNLESTVTAGIVSAKARQLNLMKRKFAIESFIQTDAAVNPGNSGGALVNKQGELVGINTAIASKTGSFSGYSFAVPVSIVKKVVSDLIEYGKVQRAILGVSVQNVNSGRAEKYDLKNTDGVYIAGVQEDGAAKEAGIQSGDVILKVNDKEVNKVSKLQQIISQHDPGDEVTVTIRRDGEKQELETTLKNMQGTTKIVKREEIEILGAKFEEPSAQLKEKLGIDFGVQVAEIGSGKLLKAGVKEDFIILTINREPVRSVSDIKQMLQAAQGAVYVKGVYPDGTEAYYAFGLK